MLRRYYTLEQYFCEHIASSLMHGVSVKPQCERYTSFAAQKQNALGGALDDGLDTVRYAALGARYASLGASY